MTFQSVEQMAIADVRGLIAGRRGSYVHFRLSREGREVYFFLLILFVRTPLQFEANIKRGSFGPEFHVVGSEPIDGSVPGQTADLPGIPEKRQSK